MECCKLITSKDFEALFNELCWEAHEIARSKGWWEEDRSPAELIALIHSELSEALEAFRDFNLFMPDSEFNGSVEEELADVIIRIADMAGAYGFNVGRAIIHKMAYNRQRPYKHGKRF